MTDYEIFIKMLNTAKIEYTLDDERHEIKFDEKKITIESNSKKIDDYWPNEGYSFFYTNFIFDKNEKLKSIGAWE